MGISEQILYRLSKLYPNPIKAYQKKLGEDPSSDEYHMNYALYQQYLLKVHFGVPYDIWQKDILEIGCGHGGIATYLAVNGARRVVGIDLNTYHMEIGKKFAVATAERLGTKEPLPVEFVEMNAYEMTYPPDSFDLVFADNVFEHFMEPQRVMQQAHKILRKGGKLIVPVFSSIYSKNALHLKNGLKLPWANLLFSEKTICNVMVRIVNEQPHLQDIYPGYVNNPTKVRDLRRYSDLNDITYGKFKRMAQDSGFEVTNFHVNGAPFYLGKFIAKTPILKNTLLSDVFSVGASAVLVKK